MTLSAPRRALRGAAPTLLVLAVLPAGASAQATRTWVSGVGDDANPCSRTAPCKTFAGAISKTAAGGVINIVDAGAYGVVTITKSITIDGRGNFAGVLGSGSNGIIVNAGTTDRVTLRNLDLHGFGNGLSGVRILSAANVRISDVDVQGFSVAGIDVAVSTSGPRRVQIRRSSIHGNYGALSAANGIWVRPTGGNTTTAKVVVSDSYIDDNANGLVVDATNGRAKITVRDSTIDDNGTSGGTGYGIRAINPEATVRLSSSEVTGNILGLTSVGSGLIQSFGNNLITANDGANTPTGTVPLS